MVCVCLLLCSEFASFELHFPIFFFNVVRSENPKTKKTTKFEKKVNFIINHTHDHNMSTKRKPSDSESIEEGRGIKRAKIDDSSRSSEEEEEESDNDSDSSRDDPTEISCEEEDECSECEYKREAIKLALIKKRGLGGCDLCGCLCGPYECSYRGDNCEGCMTFFGAHLDYEVRYLTEEELSRIPEVERVEKTDAKDPFDGVTDYNLRLKIRQVVYIDLKDTFGGVDRNDL